MEPSNLILISSDEEDKKPKTLDRKSQRVGTSMVRNGAAIQTSQQLPQSQKSLFLPRFSPCRRIIRSRSAEVLRSQPEPFQSMKRAMTAPCPMRPPRASIHATKSPVASERMPSTRHHEPAGYTLIKQPLARSRPQSSNETSAGTTKTSRGVSKEPPSTQALVHAPITKSSYRSFHTPSRPPKTTTGTLGPYQSTSRFVARPPCLNPPPEPTYIPRPPCLNPNPRPSFVDPFSQQPYLKYPYLATSKAAAPQQYVSPYLKQHPRPRRLQHIFDRPVPALQPSVPKRKADDRVENAPKRLKKEITIATPSRISSPALSKFSRPSGSNHVPSEPSTAQQSPRPPRNRAWTSVMLVDFAETLRKSFDFNAFSTKHGKAVKDIRDTFEMVVSKPIFEHSSRGMARAKMQSFNQKLKEYVAWMNRGGRDVHGELTTSPWKLSDTARAKEVESKAKEARSTAKVKKGDKAVEAEPSKGKGPTTTPKRARALKVPGEPLIYKDGIYQ